VSCQDGVGIHENEYGAFDYISLRVIMTRWRGIVGLWNTGILHTKKSFLSSCGARNCRGLLKGFHDANRRKWLVEELYRKEFIAPYLFQQPLLEDRS
jgi:hypothetical protein